MKIHLHPRCLIAFLTFALCPAVPGHAQPPAPPKELKVPNALKSNTPLLQVTDIKVSLEFYTKTLGFENTFKDRDSFSILERDSSMIFLAQKQTKVDLRNKTAREKADGYASYDLFIYCNHGTLDKLFHEFKAAGAHMPKEFDNGPVKRPYGIRDFSVIDPDGYDIVFGESTEAPKPDDATKLDLIDRTAKINADNGNFAGSKFHDVNFAGTVFDDINLSKASFNNINLKDSKFTDVNLTGATFADCDLTGVSFTNCVITGMTINGVAVEGLVKK